MWCIVLILMAAATIDAVTQVVRAEPGDMQTRRISIFKIGVVFIAAGVLLLANADYIALSYQSWKASRSIVTEQEDGWEEMPPVYDTDDDLPNLPD